jgi:hypothetical protein
MNKTFKLTAPSQTRCRELGVKFEGLQDRFNHWLNGVASGVSLCSNAHFQVKLVKPRYILVETDSATVINGVKDTMESNGYKIEEVPETSVQFLENLTRRW